MLVSNKIKQININPFCSITCITLNAAIYKPQSLNYNPIFKKKLSQLLAMSCNRILKIAIKAIEWVIFHWVTTLKRSDRLNIMQVDIG
jgi:hypothetical protein